MDQTHYMHFGKFKFLYVTVDTDLGYICVSAQSYETAKHVKHYLHSYFPVTVLPLQIKLTMVLLIPPIL